MYHIGFAIPNDVYAWTAVFILPINSAINPFLYTISAIELHRERRTTSNSMLSRYFTKNI